MIFHSPRQALAYLFAAQRGPGLARPSYGIIPRDTGRHHLDHVFIGALLYGERIDRTTGRPTGNCGVEMGGHLDKQLREWATERGVERTDQVRAIERRLRCLLRTHGVMPVRSRFKARRYDCEDGSPQLRAVGFEDEQEKPLAHVAKFCSDFGSLG